MASLGTEGRASAVTVLSQAVVRALRAEPDLDDEARKFLAFTDNRQDASLQAGHFNDFVLVGLVRSALYRAASSQDRAAPGRAAHRRGPRAASGRRRSAATCRTSPRDEDTADEPVPRKKIARALRDVVAYGCGPTSSAAGASRCPTWSRPASCA